LEVLRVWAKTGKCAATGILIDWTAGRGRDVGAHIRGPSLDRIGPGGYTNENTRLVCSGFNSLKGSSTDAEAWRFIEQARRHRRVKK